MTVKELMDTLKQFPEEMLVLTNGYEDGYTDILNPKIIYVKHNPQNEWYYGDYDLADKKDNNTIQAVGLLRKQREY